jgi:hypothetical protein
MDNLTKAFVIAASSVVILVGGVWLYEQYTVHQTLEKCIAEEVGYRDDKNNNMAPDGWHTGMSKADKREWVKYKCAERLRLDGVLSK